MSERERVRLAFLFPADLHQLSFAGLSLDDPDRGLRHREVIGQKLDQRLVGFPLARRRLDRDGIDSVGNLFYLRLLGLRLYDNPKLQD